MPDIARFEDSTGNGRAVELEVITVPADLDDYDQRVGRVPEPDPYYVDLGMLYQLALIEEVRRRDVVHAPIHVALRDTWAQARTRTSSSLRLSWGCPTTGFR